MVLPERPPPAALPNNNISWPPPPSSNVNPPWGYPPNVFPPPLNYSSSWNGLSGTGSSYPPIPPMNSPGISTGHGPPTSLSFCTPPPVISTSVPPPTFPTPVVPALGAISFTVPPPQTPAQATSFSVPPPAIVHHVPPPSISQPAALSGLPSTVLHGVSYPLPSPKMVVNVNTFDPLSIASTSWNQLSAVTSMPSEIDVPNATSDGTGCLEKELDENPIEKNSECHNEEDDFSSFHYKKPSSSKIKLNFKSSVKNLKQIVAERDNSSKLNGSKTMKLTNSLRKRKVYSDSVNKSDEPKMNCLPSVKEHEDSSSNTRDKSESHHHRPTKEERKKRHSSRSHSFESSREKNREHNKKSSGRTSRSRSHSRSPSKKRMDRKDHRKFSRHRDKSHSRGPSKEKRHRKEYDTFGRSEKRNQPHRLSEERRYKNKHRAFSSRSRSRSHSRQKVKISKKESSRKRKSKCRSPSLSAEKRNNSYLHDDLQYSPQHRRSKSHLKSSALVTSQKESETDCKKLSEMINAIPCTCSASDNSAGKSEVSEADQTVNISEDTKLDFSAKVLDETSNSPDCRGYPSEPACGGKDFNVGQSARDIKVDQSSSVNGLLESSSICSSPIHFVIKSEYDPLSKQDSEEECHITRPKYCEISESKTAISTSDPTLREVARKSKSPHKSPTKSIEELCEKYKRKSGKYSSKSFSALKERLSHSLHNRIAKRRLHLKSKSSIKESHTRKCRSRSPKEKTLTIDDNFHSKEKSRKKRSHSLKSSKDEKNLDKSTPRTRSSVSLSRSRAISPCFKKEDRGLSPKRRSKERSRSVRSSVDRKRKKSVKSKRSTSSSLKHGSVERESSCFSLRRKSVSKKLPRRRIRSRERDESPDDKPALSTEASKWISSSPAELYYSKVEENDKEVFATAALKEIHGKFQYELVRRSHRARAEKPKYEPPIRKTKLRKHKPPDMHSEDESSSSSEKSSSDEEDTSLEELEKKRRHPYRLHPELWFNDPREMNDGPLCRCSAKARRSGIRHGIYVGEEHLPRCEPFSNNAKRLHHYKIAMTPVTNFLTKSPTIIVHEGQKYIFEGFSMFSHKPLPKLPNCKVIRFNYEYTILYVEEEMPTNFTVAGLELFSKYLLEEILELVDLDWKAHEDVSGCPRFHFMPRFAKVVKNDGKELLSLNVVMEYLLNANKILVDEKKLSEVLNYSDRKWQDLADEVKGMIVTCPGMKPSSIRVDQLDREHIDSNQERMLPVIVHFGVRPPQLSYAGNPLYQKAWREYVKYRHLLANKPKVKYVDRRKLLLKETRLQAMRMENDLKRDVTVVISSKGFYRTGIMSDIVQHAMLLPVLVCHLRFHDSLSNLEEKIGYNFSDRFLLQLALTHPSYRENFGTNPDHARNSLTNCGLRQPQYGDRRIHYMNTRKRGINTLINIMSRFGSQQEATSSINHNERLEFLGDAVVEFLSSIHLFYMFPDLEEGGLATYRAAIVQNQHLAVLSKKLHLEKFMLYAHGSDLCHDLELRHAMANCFEALMGALFLDDGIEIADKVFSNTLFPEPELAEVWKNYPLHLLQEQEPDGDRKWIESVPLLQNIHKFEKQIGIEFTHIRLLARALTHRSLGYNNLTLGSNQRLEFLGDTVLQLVASEYLYKFFPQHHEGHLSLLRSSLVNNRTQAVVCGDLGMVDYAIYPYLKVDLKPKDKADLLEAFLGALYVDKDLGYCRKFCEVCFFPRLQDFIMNQEWNDPKSKLQQCCLTLRTMGGGEPDIPTYKVIECKGPTNTRVYAVAVYFQGNRLAVGSGHSIQQAEMDAAANALRKSKDLFPQLRHQKRAIERSLKQGSSRKQRQSKLTDKAKVDFCIPFLQN